MDLAAGGAGSSRARLLVVWLVFAWEVGGTDMRPKSSFAGTRVLPFTIHSNGGSFSFSPGEAVALVTGAPLRWLPAGFVRCTSTMRPCKRCRRMAVNWQTNFLWCLVLSAALPSCRWRCTSTIDSAPAYRTLTIPANCSR